MKRSEMVIKGILRLNKIDSNPFPQTNINPEDYHFVVNTLLNCFEENGMLPPKIEVGDSGFMKTTELLDYSEIDYEIKWEEE